MSTRRLLGFLGLLGLSYSIILTRLGHNSCDHPGRVGVLVYKDRLPACLAGLLTEDYRLDSRDELIAVSTGLLTLMTLITLRPTGISSTNITHIIFTLIIILIALTTLFIEPDGEMRGYLPVSAEAQHSSLNSASSLSLSLSLYLSIYLSTLGLLG